MDFRLYGANPGVIAFAVHQVAVQAYVNDLWKGECGNICHIAADAGTVISSFADGTVTAVGDSSQLGNYVTVSHAGAFTTLYAHCSRIIASSGASVKEGDVIAEVGETGVATGPHLHFELHEGSQYLNPIYYVSLA